MSPILCRTWFSCLSSKFNKCILNDSSYDPDEWFIKLDLIQSKMMTINPSFEKKGEMEIIANVIDKLPVEYSYVLTVIESSMTTISLNKQQIKSKIQAFYNGAKHKRDRSSYWHRCTKESARIAAIKGRAHLHRSKTNANGRNEKYEFNVVIIKINMPGIL